MRGHSGSAEPRGDGARRDEAGLKGQRAQHQIAAHGHLRTQHGWLYAQRHTLDEQRTKKQHRGDPLAHQVRHRGSG